MSDRRFYSIVVAIAVIISLAIAHSILSTQWKTEAIKMSLEKGQNPLYVRCAYDSNTDVCKSMIMSMALSGQFKDGSAPAAQTIPQTQKK